jgi:hypothetical protein
VNSDIDYNLARDGTNEFYRDLIRNAPTRIQLSEKDNIDDGIDVVSEILASI